MNKMMKAWSMDAVGRDRLSLKTLPLPSPAAGEVLVKVSAVSLNHRDKNAIDFGGRTPPQYPFTPASDMAGTVVELGAGAQRFKIGDQVISNFLPEWIDGRRSGNARTPPYRSLGGAFPGVLAEYLACPADWLVKAPKTLDPVAASTLPVAGLTAWSALVEQGHLQANDVVLIEGTGGVSLFGIQIAKALGAEVIVTSASDDKLAKAKALGADHGINRASEDWVESIYRITKDRGADHILEVVSGANLARALQAVAVHGRISIIGALESFESPLSIGLMLTKTPTLQGIFAGSRKMLENLVAEVDRILLKPVIEECYPMTDLTSALDHLARGPFGKIVIRVE